MITKFVVRDKTTGMFLSRAPSVGRRSWVKHISEAELYTKKHHANSSVQYTNVMKKWIAELTASGDWHNHPPSPIEIIQFDVLLIDSSKGYIG